VHTLAQSRQETLSYNSIQFWSGDNPVKASDGSDGQVRVVQQTEEGHSRSCAAVGVAEAIGEVLQRLGGIIKKGQDEAKGTTVLTGL
jgi:hypothetical protein